MISQMDVDLIRKVRGSLVCLVYFFDRLSMFMYNQALVDVRTTGTGIKCLYCTCLSAICSRNDGSVMILEMGMGVENQRLRLNKN